MPMTASRASFEETLFEDLSEHVWAHLPVRVVLRVADAAGQSGESGRSRASCPAAASSSPPRSPSPNCAATCSGTARTRRAPRN
jgi:hypothetical protein